MEVALETQERAIDGGRFLPALLHRVPIPNQVWGSDIPRRNQDAPSSSRWRGLPLIPGNEVSHIAHIIANRCGGEIFSFSHRRFIYRQGARASRGNRGWSGSLHISPSPHFHPTLADISNGMLAEISGLICCARTGH